MERMDKMEDAERKLELTRYLRQEQNLNRMKVKIGKTFCTERVKTVKCCMETMVWNWQNMTESGSRA